MSAADEGGTARSPTVRPGRKRDRTRDGAILDAAIDVLGAVGYAGLTMDAVAVRAQAGKATVYRRWPSKEKLVLDAVARLKRNETDVDPMPDTGSLRDDLIALIRSDPLDGEEHRNRAMAGLASMLSHHSAFAEAAHAALVEPWADAHRLVMRRALDRGEVPASADIDVICQVLPTMAAYRAIVRGRPVDRDFLVSSIDVVIMPALSDHPEGPVEGNVIQSARARRLDEPHASE